MALLAHHVACKDPPGIVMKRLQNPLLGFVMACSYILFLHSCLFGQGMSTINRPPAPKPKFSSKPFEAKFIETHEQVGLNVRLLAGNETEKPTL